MASLLNCVLSHKTKSLLQSLPDGHVLTEYCFIVKESLPSQHHMVGSIDGRADLLPHPAHCLCCFHSIELQGQLTHRSCVNSHAVHGLLTIFKFMYCVDVMKPGKTVI